MSGFDPESYARLLAAHGYRAGTHGREIVVELNGVLWRVVGGNAQSPTLMKAPKELTAQVVSWVEPWTAGEQLARKAARETDEALGIRKPGVS